jgi:hypothetical protein
MQYTTHRRIRWWPSGCFPTPGLPPKLSGPAAIGPAFTKEGIRKKRRAKEHNALICKEQFCKCSLAKRFDTFKWRLFDGIKYLVVGNKKNVLCRETRPRNSREKPSIHPFYLFFRVA